jgi:hypothetical protein
MKTKPFLLATAGATVDGRTIDDKMLKEMASSYDPKTYTARLNIEHIRGISGDKPFRAYGDVLELSTGEVDVNFNGRTEKRLGLFGVLDVTDDAKALNDAGQKVFPSIEVQDNFANKGFAYLMGCALTDSPAAIATDRLQFNRAMPGVLSVTADQSGIAAAAIEPSDEDTAAAETASSVKGFFTKLTEMLGGAAPAKAEPEQKPAAPAGLDLAAFAAELTKAGEGFATAIDKQAQAFNGAVASLRGEVTALKQQVENTADPKHQQRPPANGPTGQYARTDC